MASKRYIKNGRRGHREAPECSGLGLPRQNSNRLSVEELLTMCALCSTGLAGSINVGC